MGSFQSENALARRPQAEKVARAIWAFGWLVKRLLCSRRLLLCSESNAYAIGPMQRKMFRDSHPKLFQERRLTDENVFSTITWISTDVLAMPERWAHAST